MALQPFVGPWPHFSILTIYMIGRAPRSGDQPVARPLPTDRIKQTHNKSKQTSMTGVGFQPTTSAGVGEDNDGLDRSPTVISARVPIIHISGDVVQ
jgi:hypothetical protein